jgi:glycosyltransferase involved in cell wall biosynthesis
MIRILHVLGGLHNGGMENMVMNYHRKFDRNKVTIDFLVFSVKSYFDDEAISLGSEIHYLMARRKKPLQHYKDVYDFFKNNKIYDIVHIHQGITSFSVLFACKIFNVKHIIVHSHGVDLKFRKKYKLLYNLFAIPVISKMADVFLACSDSAACELYSDKIIKNKDYHLMRNAIDTDKFAFNFMIRSLIRNELNLDNKFVLINIARFSYQKNHSFLIDIFNEVYKRNDSARLLLVGGPGEPGILEEIKSKVKKLGLNEVVIFMGIRSDAYKLLQASDVFVLPSLFEGLPVVGIEAQASGIKCFLSDSITVETKVTDLVDFISLGRNASFWAEEILKLVSGYKRNNVKQEIISAGYDINISSQWLENFYLNLSR